HHAEDVPLHRLAERGLAPFDLGERVLDGVAAAREVELPPDRRDLFTQIGLAGRERHGLGQLGAELLDVPVLDAGHVPGRPGQALVRGAPRAGPGLEPSRGLAVRRVERAPLADEGLGIACVRAARGPVARAPVTWGPITADPVPTLGQPGPLEDRPPLRRERGELLPRRLRPAL